MFFSQSHWRKLLTLLCFFSLLSLLQIKGRKPIIVFFLFVFLKRPPLQVLKAGINVFTWNRYSHIPTILRRHPCHTKHWTQSSPIHVRTSLHQMSDIPHNHGRELRTYTLFRSEVYRYTPFLFKDMTVTVPSAKWTTFLSNVSISPPKKTHTSLKQRNQTNGT